MGGGASKPAVDLDALDVEPSHTEPFFIELELTCEDLPKAPLWHRKEEDEEKIRAREEQAKLYQQTSVKVYLKMYANQAPYACENFLRLCGKPVAEGGLIGSLIHDIKPGVYVHGGQVQSGKKKAANASAFPGGAPFENECEEDIDHGDWSLSMTSGNGLAEGLFGSNFSICMADAGTVKAAMLDDDDGSFVIGRVVDGYTAFEVLDSLMGSQQWMDIQAKNKGQNGGRGACGSPGGPPARPVTITAAEVVTWREKRTSVPRIGDGGAVRVRDVDEEAEAKKRAKKRKQANFRHTSAYAHKPTQKKVAQALKEVAEEQALNESKS